jgi:hypothetical protein
MRNATTFNARQQEPRAFLRVLYQTFSVAGDSTMDQHDQELLEKQLRAINGAPPRAGVIIVTILTVFLAGMTLGGLLAGSTGELTRVVDNDMAPAPSIMQ